MTGSGALCIPTALLVLHVLLHVNTKRATVLALVRQKHSFSVLAGRMWLWYYELSSFNFFFNFSVQTCIAKVWKREELNRSANLLPYFSISHMLFTKQIHDTNRENKIKKNMYIKKKKSNQKLTTTEEKGGLQTD